MAYSKTLDPDGIRVFSGSSHKQLACGIADSLGVPLSGTISRRFSNDCLYVQLGDSVRGRVVHIVQSLVPPVSDHLMELLMMIDAARGGAAKEVHAVIPYFSFARSDKKDAPRISITAKLVADLLQTAGATHVVTMTLHSPQVHGFFSVPTDHLTARKLFIQHFRKTDLSDTIVVAPDAGAARASQRLSKALNVPTVAAAKTRHSDSEVSVSEMISKQVQGFRRAIIYDDEIATGGSMIALSEVLVQSGVQEICAACTHGVFSGPAIERIKSACCIHEIVTTDSVPIAEDKRLPNMRILSVAPIFGEAIRRNYTGRSISSLFAFGSDDEDDTP